MAFWMALLVSLAMTVVGELLRPKQKPQNAQASGLDDFDLPTAEEGRSIPVFAGKVKITGPNVVAYGDLESLALTRKVKTGLFSSTRQTYAHRYFLGMQCALAHGRDDLDIHEIHFGDAMPNHTRTDEGEGVIRFDFDDEDMFGGDEKEGGVSGTMRFYCGADTQPASGYLASLIGESAPAYRGLCHAVMEKMYLGTSHYIKPISFVVSSYPNQLGVADGKHKIGDDANPICFIYEILVNAVWGVGLSGTDVDLPQWRAVAEKVHGEGYGVSLLYNGASSAKEVIEDILRHIDGVMYSDPETGLIAVRLARADYDVESIPVYGPEDFIGGINFARPSWMDTKNTVKASYVDREADYTTAVVSQQDLANVHQRGGEVVVEDLDFTGFSSYDPAALAVARALKTLSYPLARLSGSLTRRAWAIKPADVFVLHWPELGIESVVMRVNSVRYGGIRDNTVSIEAVEDIFSISDVAYVQPPPSGWVNPLVPPVPMAVQAAAEMPYGMEPSEGSIIGTFGARMGGLDEGYKVLSDRAAPFNDFQERALVTVFTPVATLSNDYPVGGAFDAIGFQFDGLRGRPDSGSLEFARVVSGAGEEWIGYEGLQGNMVTRVYRGVFDTVPLDHNAGATVYFATAGYGRENDGSPYTGGETVHVRLLPFNPRGTLPEGEAALVVVPTSNRGSRPYPPGRIRVDGVHPLEAGPIEGTFAVSWAHRNRLHPTMLTQDDLSVDPEPGTAYTVYAYAAGGALLAAGSGNMTSASVTLAYEGTVRIEVESERDGLKSLNRQVFEIDYAGEGPNQVTVDEAEYILDGGGA